MGSEGITPRSEDPRALFAGCAGVGVDAGSEFDVDEPDRSDDRFPSCTRQGSSNSAGPEVDVPFRPLGNRPVDADVGDLEASTWFEYAFDLAVGAVLIDHEIEHTV